MSYNKNTINRLIRNYIYPHKYKILFALVMMIISAASTGLHAWLVRPALDEVLIKGNKQMLLLIPIAIIIITLIKGIATYLHSIQMSKVAHQVIADLQSEAFEKLMFFNLSFFNNSKTGELVSRLTNDTFFLRMAIVKTVTGVIKDFFVVIFLVGNMFYQSWQLTIFAFFAFPLALWPIKLIGKRIRKIANTVQKEIAAFAAILNESIKSIRQVKSYNQEDFETKRSLGIINQVKNYFIRSDRIRNRLSPIMEFIGSLAVALSIYIGGIFVINQDMTTGQFMSFLVSLLLAYQPIKALGNLNVSIQEGLASADRIFQLIDQDKIFMEKDEKEKNELKVSKGNIELKNLNFSYNEGEEIFENLNISIPASKKIAIVGFSGSGKSTIINLLLRFYDNYKGEILIDGQNIKNCSIKSVRKNLSLVSQDTILFNDTIEANISYGKSNVTFDEMVKVSKEAGAIDFIEKLPNKFNTLIGEGGVKLSGGQRQRIAIARALLKNSPILLLDEATSSLDNINEKKIQKSINELMKNRTSLVIAHRLSTIEDADFIYVLDKGKIIEFGRHDELLKNNNLYAKLQLKEKLNEN
tara:strand:- start:11191 stop:12939 length:1749 start_codon:yes stop_codon:yes gene_type:complete